MKTLYCISGLGADFRLFQRISIDGYKLKYLEWPVFNKGDTLPTYAQKVSALIAEDNPTILGVSFGGMIATEISKIRKTNKVIIISSAKHCRELSYSNFISRAIVSMDILPKSTFNVVNPIVYWFLGVESKEEKALLKSIIKDSDPAFVNRAVKLILDWKSNNIDNGKVTHIHGKNDKVILPKRINAHYWINDGGHFMIYNRHKMINDILKKELITSLYDLHNRV